MRRISDVMSWRTLVYVWLVFWFFMPSVVCWLSRDCCADTHWSPSWTQFSFQCSFTVWPWIWSFCVILLLWRTQKRWKVCNIFTNRKASLPRHALKYSFQRVLVIMRTDSHVTAQWYKKSMWNRLIRIAARIIKNFSWAMKLFKMN